MTFRTTRHDPFRMLAHLALALWMVVVGGLQALPAPCCAVMVAHTESTGCQTDCCAVPLQSSARSATHQHQQHPALPTDCECRAAAGHGHAAVEVIAPRVQPPDVAPLPGLELSLARLLHSPTARASALLAPPAPGQSINILVCTFLC